MVPLDGPSGACYSGYMSTVLDNETIEETTIDTSDGDHDRFAHYFKKADLDKAFFDGIPITAMCGKKDIPMRDPQKYKVCPQCKEFYDGLPTGD